jgi:nitrate/nitrite transporter NarK
MAMGATSMGIASLALLSSGAPDSLRLAALLAFSLLGGVVPACVFSGAPVHARSPQHAGTANGMIMQASHLSQFAVPIVVAWVATRLGGWHATLGVMLALSCVGVLAGLGVARFERKRGPL